MTTILALGIYKLALYKNGIYKLGIYKNVFFTAAAKVKEKMETVIYIARRG